MSNKHIDHSTLLANFPTAIIITDDFGKIIYLNKQALDLLSVSDTNQIVGSLISDFISFNDVDDNDYKTTIFDSEIKKLIINTTKQVCDYQVHHCDVYNNGKNTEICIQLSKISSQQNVSEQSSPLTLNENKLRSIINYISDIITLVDDKGTILYQSKSISNILGYEQLALIGKNIFEFIHPEDLNDTIISFSQNVAGTNDNSSVFRFRAKNGEYVYLESKGNNQLNNKEVAAIIVSSQDVTERIRNEQNLYASYKELSDYKFVLDQSSIVAITDIKGTITYVNDTFCRISKYTVSELIGNDHRIINSGYHPKSFFIELWKTISNGKVWRGEIKNKAKDGSYYWVDTTIVPFLDTKGKPYQYMAVRFDVTERKKIEEEAKILTTAIANTTDSVVITDTGEVDGVHRVMYANLAFSKMTGYALEEIIGNSLKILQGELTNRSEIERLKTALQQWQPCEVEVINYKKNGEIFWNNFSVHPVADEKGWYTHWISIEKDITERKNREQELKAVNLELKKQSNELARSNAELEQFAYIASHDLQEPLRMITGFMSQLKKKYSDQLDERALKYIHFANDGAIRMRQLILDLLDYSRAGRVNETRTVVDLNQIVEDVIYLNRAVILEKKATINYDKLPVIFTSKIPIQQLFQNLLSNALKYQKEGVTPKINITCSEDNDYWKFAVSDNGIGIQSQYFDKIFIVFQRLHNRDEYSGTGIGLAICKKIIENYGGTIKVESEEGIGTSFYFTISKAYCTQ